MSTTVDPEREWKEAFALFDKSGNGTLLSFIHLNQFLFVLFFLTRVRGAISTDELRIVLEQLGASASAQQVREFIQSVDDNGDGKIQYNEFVQGHRSFVVIFCLL